MKNTIDNLVDKYWEEIVEARRQIHMNPELSFQEYKTSALIKEKLDKYNIQYKDNIAKTGVVGILEGKSHGKTIALRCDMDALPVEEKTNVDFSSKNKGISHVCGHDAHTAMILGTALVLNELRDQIKGNIKLIFQPAEEHGLVGGAKIMIKEGVLKNPDVDAIFGMHVWPDVPEGYFQTIGGEMMACCDIWNVNIKGKGGHISAPHYAINPIHVAANFINTLGDIRTQKVDPMEKIIFDIGVIKGGLANNIIPDQVILGGNTRLYNNEIRLKIKQYIENTLEGYKIAYGIDYDLDYILGYGPVVNDNEMANIFKLAATKVIGEDKVTDAKPVMGAEDFGEYLLEIPGAFGWIGLKQDEYIPCHNPSFIVDEATIKRGILIFCQTVFEYLNN